MIKASTGIAVAAIVLSLLLHMVGLNVIDFDQPKQSAGEGSENVVTLDNAFEDLAEPLSDAPPQETTPPPELDHATVPEPETTETPTSEALVAAETPQDTFSPDTGTAQEVTPRAAGSSEAAPGQIVEPQAVEPSGAASGGEQESLAKQEPVEPTVPETTVQPPVTPNSTPPVTSSAPVTPSVAVAPSPVPSEVPTVPLPDALLPPETLEALDAPITEEPTPENAAAETAVSDLAVATSLRPKPPPRRSEVAATGQREDATELSDLRSPPLIESPLSAYQRGQSNPFAGQNGGSQAEGFGLLGSRATGNSRTTNYAGRVLLHLNRAPSAQVSIPGTVRVVFEINPDGSLARVDITSNTGTKELARAARRQVQSAAPFPPPPKGAPRRMSFVYRSN
ncbi:TonB family protein [Pseudophaeobacter sp.]|uniref:TonB family protein n=1 Tax=Pseudophaeobacter sp. TaxID=1971739 RepID=UPI003297A269